MSAKQIFESPRCKTNLIFRDGDGIRIERIDRQTSQRVSIRLNVAELDGLMAAWPEMKDFLHSAGALTAEQGMPSPSGSKGSPEPARSPSSPSPRRERTLL